METLEELKAIIDNAPEGATHYDSLATWKYKNLDRGTFLMPDGTGYKIDEFYPNETIRSLSDIERIIELMEIVEDAAALGFLTPSFDSGVSHKQLCKKYDALKRRATQRVSKVKS